MRTKIKKTIGVGLLMVVFLIVNHVTAQEPSQGDQPAGEKEKQHLSVPDLADITPLATELAGRLANLENMVSDLSQDVDVFEKKYAVIEKNLQRPYAQLQQMKDTEGYNYKRLVALREKSGGRKENVGGNGSLP